MRHDIRPGQLWDYFLDAIVLTDGFWKSESVCVVYNLVTMTYYTYGSGPWTQMAGITEILSTPEHIETFLTG